MHPKAVVRVTTRRRNLQSHAGLSLDVLTNDAGLALLNNGERQFGPEAYALVEALGGLPLALELTKYFLNQRSALSIDQLLVEMNRRGELDVLSTQNWRGLSSSLSRLLELAPFPLPFLLNLVDLVFYQRLRKLLFELKQAPSWARRLRPAIEME